MDFAAPFRDGDGLLRFARGTVAKGKDLMICNEGREGSGKSTTGANIAKGLNPDFNMKRDSIKNLDHLLDVLHNAEEGQLYFLDESINIFHNQDWATWEAKMLSKVIRQMRIMKSVWILNQPDFAGLHPYVRENRIPIRIYHPPVYGSDGMGNGPSQVLWKHEWLDWRSGEVRHRWECVIDELEVPCLDDDPAWQGYESDKRQNFRDVVASIQARREVERAKAQTKKGKK